MIHELFSLAGKVALVTGGSRGIGMMIAEGLLRAGAKVYISSRKADACDEAVRELSRFGEIHAIPADVSDEAQCKSLIDAIAKREEKLHLLFNNAGATWGAPVEEFPDKGWDKILALNLKAPFHLTKFALPLLRAAATDDDPARVVNIGSIDGLVVPIFDNFSYSASKAGIHHLTRHLAAVVGPKVAVNAIAPGPFPSKMMEQPLEAIGDQIVARSRLGRIGKTEDIAGMAIFLSSRASSFMTGAVIPLDGGISTTV